MAWEPEDEFSQSLKGLSQSEPFIAPTTRRIMELRLLRNALADVPEDDTRLPEFDTPEELANYILGLLHEAVDKGEEIWQRFELNTDPEEAMKTLEEGVELRSMVEAYLSLPDGDTRLLEDQHDEIMQQKIAFVDAVIELWLKDAMPELYDKSQEEKIRKILGGKAVRLTPLTQQSIKEWIAEGTPPDELFCDGYISGVSTLDGTAAVSMGQEADGSGPVTDYIPVWRRDNRSGELIQEAQLEVIDPSEIRR